MFLGNSQLPDLTTLRLAKILQPQLTTVHLPHRFMGEMAAQALYDAVINNEPVKASRCPSQFGIAEPSPSSIDAGHLKSRSGVIEFASTRVV